MWFENQFYGEHWPGPEVDDEIITITEPGTYYFPPGSITLDPGDTLTFTTTLNLTSD
jgi:plastocyanin